MRLRNINLAPRATLFFSAIILLVVVLGVIAILQMGKLRDTEKDVELNWLPSIRQTAMMNSTVLRVRLETQRAVADPQTVQQTIVKFPAYRKAMKDAVYNYETLIASDQERQLFLAVKKSYDDYASQLDLLEPLLKAGDTASIVKLVATGIRPLTNQMETQVEELTQFNNKGAALAGVQATQVYDSGLYIVIGLIIFVALLTLCLATLLTKTITSPIGSALSVAERIASSDLTKEVEVSGTDEAGRLLSALATMQQNLRSTIMQIADSSSQLAAASEEMTAVTEQSSLGLVSQNDEVNQAATAVTEMSAAVDEVARNAESASEESRKGQGYTEVGLERVSQTLKSIEKLSSNVRDTSEQITGLSNRAQNISKVVEVIRAIAEQTNLLALNAAIEAARACETGRGFAVVADEVRALASKTQSSTGDIQEHIIALQRGAKEAVAAIGIAGRQAKEGLEVLRDSAKRQQTVQASVEQVHAAIGLATQAAVHQAEGAQAVRGRVEVIHAQAEKAAKAVVETTASGKVLNGLAAQLKASLGQFRA
ncbi:hypothetical protein ALP29_200696 [Pseudomonas syringae pv. avii]|uniref:Methyl-accepting chemotaxis protein n=1 Tax=Pseudomonas syringae pv. avii TaxID=663959 RepID=A0A3M5U8X8_PSESX|nr:hypothetical protein ALP29_200696 [Pseudomonas syringae pv. avii]